LNGTEHGYSNTPAARRAPVVRITLRGPNGHAVPHLALIDSGADGTLLPWFLAADLGIKLEACDPVAGRGVGGPATFKQWPQDISALIDGVTIRVPAVFGPVNQAVLGRSDFFNAFRVTIDERARTFVLDPY
jgi:hypothetical protein